MTRYTLSLSLLGAFFLLLSTAPAQAGDRNRRGGAGAQELLIPFGARTYALGGAVTANMTGIEALFSNPAGLAYTGGTEAMFSRVQYVADIGLNYLGVAQTFGYNTLGLSVQALTFGDIPITTEDQPEGTGSTFNPTFITVGFSYARIFTDRIAGGVTIKLINESIDRVSASGVAADLGVQYVVGETGLRFGVALKNIGPAMRFDGDGFVRFVNLPEQRPDATTNGLKINPASFELPSLMNVGVSYQYRLAGGAALTAMGNFRSNSFTEDEFQGGLEFNLRDVLYRRGAYAWQQTREDTWFNGLNFGAGLNLKLATTSLSVDYSYTGTRYAGLGAVQTISVRLKL